MYLDFFYPSFTFMYLLIEKLPLQSFLLAAPPSLSLRYTRQIRQHLNSHTCTYLQSIFLPLFKEKLHSTLTSSLIWRNKAKGRKKVEFLNLLFFFLLCVCIYLPGYEFWPLNYVFVFWDRLSPLAFLFVYLDSKLLFLFYLFTYFIYLDMNSGP